MRTLRFLPRLSLAVAAMLAPSTALALEPAGPEFQVHTYTGCHQDQHEVAALEDGGFVVVWKGGLAGAVGCVQDGSSSAVFGQRFDDQGARVGTEFQVNTITTDEQEQPVVAGTPGGGFVVVWESAHLGADADDVQARLYDGSGQPDGTEFTVNVFTTQDQYGPSVAATADGFVVAWSSVTDQPPYGGTFARVFDTDGTPAGGEIPLASTWPSVLVPDSDGGFFAFVLRTAGLEGRRFAADATPSGDEFLIPGVVDADLSSSIAPADDGGFLLVTDKIAAADTVRQAWGRRFSADGTAVGSAFQINTAQGPREPVISRSGNGQYLVAWERTPAGDDQPAARQLTADGEPAGTELQLTTNPAFESVVPRVAGLAQGGFAASWERFDGSGSGVYARVFVPGGCADATDDGSITASDALLALRAAVGSAECALCICDVDSSGTTTASDALAILRVAVGSGPDLVCPAC